MATSQAQGGTRSGLLWEVERILDELFLESREREESTLPQILLMENVPEVIGKDNVKYFNQWLSKLESLGYSNYFQILNSKDFGIPQNRRRCFMVSLLNGFAYDFPLKIKLKYRLKDFLEKQVDEKYYLNQKDIERISNWNSYENPIESAIDIERERERVMPTLTARGAGEEHSGMKLLIVPNEIPIKENNNLGYKIAQVGDGVNLASRMKHQRGNVQKGSIQTLKAQMEIGVVVDDERFDKE